MYNCITAQPALLRAMRNLRVVRRPHDGRLRPILPDFAHKLPNFSAILTDFIPETDLDPVCQAYWRWGCPNHPGRLCPFRSDGGVAGPLYCNFRQHVPET